MLSESDDLHAEIGLEQDQLQTLQDARSGRPQNTSKAYRSKQCEFIQWMEQQRFIDGVTVTGPKVHSFLRTVMSRPNRRQAGAVIGYSSLKAYGAACIDLYNQQKFLNTNSNSHPRDNPALKQLFRFARNSTHALNRANFSDRGAGTLQDGYTTIEELQKICNYFTSQNSLSGAKNKLMFLLCHFCLLRGESVRRCELADLFALDLENEGYTPCKALIVVMDQGKTNQFGRKDLGSCIRHKNPEVCAIGCLGFYFLRLWHLDLVPAPNLTTSRNWFDLKLIPGRSGPSTEITYQTHLNGIRDCFSALGISAKAKTHVGRGSGARMAELGGADEADIRRLGRWNAQALAGCYLSALPRAAIRTMAGFPPEAGQYYLKRANTEPCELLQRQIFPWIEEYLNGVVEYEKTLAVQGYLRLLKFLRIVVLQDAAVLIEKFPDDLLFKLPIFHSVQFLAFKQQVIRQMDLCDPIELRLQNAMPDLSAKIDSVHGSIVAKIDELRQETSQTREVTCRLSSELSDLVSGRAPIYINRVPANVPVPIPVFTDTAIVQHASPVDVPDAPLTVPQYRLSRNLFTVDEVWREYKVGLGGNPSVESLELRYGARWRPSDSERKFFSRRQKIYKNIAASISGGQTDTAAVKVLEDLRIASNWSLDKLQKQL
jgi:hypothetical protein